MTGTENVDAFISFLNTVNKLNFHQLSRNHRLCVATVYHIHERDTQYNMKGLPSEGVLLST